MTSTSTYPPRAHRIVLPCRHLLEGNSGKILYSIGKTGPSVPRLGKLDIIGERLTSWAGTCDQPLSPKMRAKMQVRTAKVLGPIYLQAVAPSAPHEGGHGTTANSGETRWRGKRLAQDTGL